MLDRLFDPRSVAIVGASSDRTKIGNVVFRNLMGSGYKGKIYPVNPSAESIEGIRSFPSVSSIGFSVDLAVVVVPSTRSLGVLQECVTAGIPYVIMIPGGFSETGDEGDALQKKIKDDVSGSRTRVLGPNTVGIYVPGRKLNTTLTPLDRVAFPGDGIISFISQSGALGLLTMDRISEFGTGIQSFINVGNRSDLDEIDLLRYMKNRDDVKSIAIYLESIPRGRELYTTLKDITPVKPVVVLKSGRTEISARAASLHTGAMATDDRVTEGMLRQAGVIRASSEIELLDVARVLAYDSLPDGKRAAVLTTAGGVGVVTTDMISLESGEEIELAKFSESTKKAIRDIIVPFGSAENPIDMTADGSIEQVDALLDLLNESAEVDLIILYALPQTPKMDLSLAEVVSKRLRTGKPIVVGVLGFKQAKVMLSRFEELKIPSYPDIRRTVVSAAALARYARYRRRANEIAIRTR